jgi:CheY-like chemotaxis protein
VDDEALVREITAESLEEAGFSVVAAGGAAAALERLDQGEAVDLLVCDLSMPGMDGLVLIREAQRRRPGLPVILLTGFATNAAELAVSGAVAGTFSLLRKPVSPAHLAERISVLLAGTESPLQNGAE